MNATRLAAVALATLLVTVGLTAATPAAPAEHRTTNPPDAAAAASDRDARDAGPSVSNDSVGPAGAASPVDASNRADTAGDPERGDAAERDGARGPPSDLPAPVPDHVGAIHDTIRSFLSGALDGSLGEAVSGIASDEAPKGAHAGG